MKRHQCFVFFLGVYSFMNACSNDNEINNQAVINQIGDMKFTNMQTTWTCKMLAHDFDKYYPTFNKLIKDLKERTCLTEEINTFDFIPQMNLTNAKIPTLPVVDFASRNVCNNDLLYANSLATHVTNLKTLWMGKCDRSVPATDTEEIWETPACLAPCLPSMPGCYTCTPGKNNFDEKGVGTITCSSEKDAIFAVEDYCFANKIEKCNPKCRFVKGNPKQIRFAGGGLSGSGISDSFSNSVSFNGSIRVNLGLSIPMISVTNSNSISGTFDLTSSVIVGSNMPHMFQDIMFDLDNPLTWRKEYSAATLYSCSISTATITNLTTGFALNIGFSDSNWHGLGATINFGPGVSTSYANSSRKSYSRVNNLADGKTIEDVKKECSEWSKRAFLTYVIARPDKIKPLFLSAEGIQCDYQTHEPRFVKEVGFTFNDDGSGILSYRAKRHAGLLKSFNYPVQFGLDAYIGPVATMADKKSSVDPAMKKELLLKALNSFVKDASQKEKDDWKITNCW